MPVNQLLSVAPSLLQSGETQLEVVSYLLDRLLIGVENERDTKLILRMIATYSAPNPRITEQLVELLSVSEYPLAIVDKMSQVSKVYSDNAC